jgi:hypothetical protein
LQVRPLFGHDRVLHGANLQADAAINAGRKINPVEVGAFGVLGITRVNASDGASIHTVGNTFTSICNDGMRHFNGLRVGDKAEGKGQRAGDRELKKEVLGSGFS